jgi:hypothetical protein
LSGKVTGPFLGKIRDMLRASAGRAFCANLLTLRLLTEALNVLKWLRHGGPYRRRLNPLSSL